MPLNPWSYLSKSQLLAAVEGVELVDRNNEYRWDEIRGWIIWTFFLGISKFGMFANTPGKLT